MASWLQTCFQSRRALALDPLVSSRIFSASLAHLATSVQEVFLTDGWNSGVSSVLLRCRWHDPAGCQWFSFAVVPPFWVRAVHDVLQKDNNKKLYFNYGVGNSKILCDCKLVCSLHVTALKLFAEDAWKSFENNQVRYTVLTCDKCQRTQACKCRNINLQIV